MSEERPIPFAPGYSVTDEGRVVSVRSGRRIELRPWTKRRHGHLVVGLRMGGRTVRWLVHRLVLTMFVGPPPYNCTDTRHLDGDPSNNRLSNLAWGTHAENMADMIRHGTQGAINHPERMPRGPRHGSKTKPWRVARGERAGGAKITHDVVRAIRILHQELGCISEVARRLALPRGVVKCIIQGKTWKHVA